MTIRFAVKTEADLSGILRERDRQTKELGYDLKHDREAGLLHILEKVFSLVQDGERIKALATLVAAAEAFADTEAWVPLMMGEKFVGKIFFDVDGGVITGKLSDKNLAPLLNEVFGMGLMSVSFNGKPGIPTADANAKIREFMDSE